MCRALPMLAGLLFLLTAAARPTLAAPLTAEQKRELSDIRSDAGKVASLVSRKKFEEAEQALSEAESRLEKIIKEAELSENDLQVRAIRKVIETQRALLTKASGGKAGAMNVSFVTDVAPILADKCLSCHDESNSSGGLRLDTFAGIERGGRSGPVLVPRNPMLSLLMQRVGALNPQLRMPKNAEALSDQELRTLAAWIAAGAVFDGTEKNVSLALLTKNPVVAKQKIEIVKATGNETVSFIRDVAPTFVTTCGGCHGNQRSGGLSLATFEGVMIGGESGRVIVPGDVEASILFQKLRDGDMPRGNQARITRKFYADLQTWIKEGAKFDGSDPKRPLRELIPTPEQLRAAELAKLTTEGWLEKRRNDSLALWKQSFPQAMEPNLHETPEFVLIGDVSQRRLEEVGSWAEEQAAALRSQFHEKDGPLFKGKLTIFVFKDRFGYEEFNSTIHRREVPREVVGHSDVTAAQDRAFVAVLDVGDEANPSSPGMQLNVMEHVTGAYLKRDGGNMPDWLSRGAGLALASSKAKDGNAYVAALRGRAGDALRQANLNDPAEVFQNGQFSPADIGPVGYVLVDYLLRQGGVGRFGQLVRRFQAGDDPQTAIQTAYQTTPRQLGASFLQSASLATSGKKAKKGN